MIPKNTKLTIACLALTLLISACGKTIRDGAPSVPIEAREIEDAVPRAEPLSKQGNAASYVIQGHRYFTLKSSRGFVQQGIASWYGTRFHGHKTANGETYDMYKMTAAHKTLPLPSYMVVTNLDNGREITVRVNDRGPFVDGRIIDLSYAAATKLGIQGSGTARVEIRDARIKDSELDIVSANNPALYYLQLGAFRDRDNASQLKQRVSAYISDEIRISAVKVQDDTLHRVRIGPFTARRDADQVSERLIRQGVISQALLLRQP